MREQVPSALLSHFIHVPWAEPDYWHTLPSELRRAVHEGLLANDVIGFHTDRWRRNFLSAVRRSLGAECDSAAGVVRWNGRETRVVTRPISIDPAEFVALKDSAGGARRGARLLVQRPEFLILRVDRTDPSKNIVRGFRGVRLFLESHPEFFGRVRMLALLDPSRQDLQAYVDYRAAVERAADAVNSRFAREGWKPIDLQIADNFPQAVAAYKQYDVLLVNAVFDGMNLVAKEAPLVERARRRADPLRERRRARGARRVGLTVNPFDVDGQADAIYAALTMSPEDRKLRAKGITDFVRANDIDKWIADQLDDLDHARAVRVTSPWRSSLTSTSPPAP